MMRSGARVYMLLRNAFTHDSRVEKEAASLARAGYRVTVIALTGPGLPARESRDGYEVRRIRISAPLILPESRSARDEIRKSFTVARTLLEQAVGAWSVMRGDRADVVHAHDLSTLLQAYLLARLARAALVYDSHEIFLESLGRSKVRGAVKRIWRAYESFLIRRADAVITVNESIADHLAALYRIPRPHVVMNAADVSLEAPDPSALRERAGIPPGAKIVLYHGGLGRDRGLPELVTAMRQVPEAFLVFLGGGVVRPELIRLSEQLGLEDRIRFLDPVPPRELLRYVAGADLGVIPIRDTTLNHRYSTPNKLFECIAAGVPVAASDLPEIARVVRAHRIGTLFDPDDPGAIARAIRDVLEDPDPLGLRERVRAAAPHFTWTAQAERLIAVYRALPARR